MMVNDNQHFFFKISVALNWLCTCMCVSFMFPGIHYTINTEQKYKLRLFNVLWNQEPNYGSCVVHMLIFCAYFGIYVLIHIGASGTGICFILGMLILIKVNLNIIMFSSPLTWMRVFCDPIYVKEHATDSTLFIHQSIFY